MQQCFQLVKENLGDAVAVQKAYFNPKTKEKTFVPGDRVMVWHAMLPKHVNPKFYKKWHYAKIVKMIGPPLNVQVLDKNDRKKPYIIHVNRVVMVTSQQIREDCDSILSPYEDDIQTGVAHEEPREKDRKVDEFDEEQFGPYTCTASSQPGQQPGQQQKRRHVGTIPKQRYQGQIPQQIPQHESRVRPRVIKARGERDKCPTSAAASASQERAQAHLSRRRVSDGSRRRQSTKLSKNNFCRRSREDSDFYGFDEEEEENFFKAEQEQFLPTEQRRLRLLRL
jgi:hypothetical protein